MIFYDWVPERLLVVKTAAWMCHVAVTRAVGGRQNGLG